MKYFPIFALFLMFACCEETNPIVQCVCVEQFSDALPIQIWPNDCNTYNETDPDGVHYKCFCHSWKCTDSIPLQFTSDEDSEYELVIFNEEDDEVTRIPFIQSALDGSPEIPGDTTSVILPLLSFGTNIVGPDTDWITGSNPSLTLIGGVPLATTYSNILAWPYLFVEGDDYEFTFDIDYTFHVNTFVSNIIFVILDDSNNILQQHPSPNISAGSGTYLGPATFTAPSGAVKYGIFVQSAGALSPTSTVDIDSISATRTTPATPAVPTTQWGYHNSFVPSDHGVCNQKIKARVVKVSVSPEESIGKTDCIEVSDANQDPTVLITYFNNRNFAGLFYNNLSPTQELNIRVPAVFFHERFPEEDEAIELSDSRIINLNGVVRAQRLLDTAYMPYYMHRKMKLVLKHSNVSIDRLAVTKQDAYEVEEGDRRWPVKKAKCWLTEKDFVQRNVV